MTKQSQIFGEKVRHATKSKARMDLYSIPIFYKMRHCTYSSATSAGLYHWFIKKILSVMVCLVLGKVNFFRFISKNSFNFRIWILSFFFLYKLLRKFHKKCHKTSIFRENYPKNFIVGSENRRQRGRRQRGLPVALISAKCKEFDEIHVTELYFH